MSLAQLAEATEASAVDVHKGLGELKGELAKHGLQITEARDSYSLTTASSTTAAVERFLGAQAKVELTKPALETLAIIAYKQPVTKSQIEEIRGVASDQSIRNLLVRGLIVESGQSPEPGRPILYATSHKFLQLLGLKHAGELASLETLKGDEAATA